MTEPDPLVRELHHRVKNTLQIIVSLMGLKAHMIPAERQQDLRFLRDHVHAMAAAYRLVYESEDMATVPVGLLIAELISDFRQIRSFPSSRIRFDGIALLDPLKLDHGIALSLFLASVMPPCLESAARSNARVEVSASVQDRVLSLSIRGGEDADSETDPLAARFRDVYSDQLRAVMDPKVMRSDVKVKLSLDP